MLYSEKTTVVLFSSNPQKLEVDFSYQFIKKPEYEIHLLGPKTIYMSKRCRARQETHRDPHVAVESLPLLMKSTENVKRSIHFIPDITFSMPYQISVFMALCHMTVHEGPGTHSPILYESPVVTSHSSVRHDGVASRYTSVKYGNNVTWSGYTYLQLYIIFTCRNNLENSLDYLEYHNLDTDQTRNFSQPYLQLPVQKDLKDIMDCANQVIQPINVSSGYFAVQVVSHPNKNRWCVIRIPPNNIWIADVTMQYLGPSHLYSHHQSLACQLGGVFMFSETAN